VGAFAAQVRPRWSDMDAFGHINHANTVTLLEEARIALLFGEGVRRGADDMARGIVVVRLTVDYQAPLVFSGEPLCVEISVRELRSASFTLDYIVHSGPSLTAPVAVTAETLLVPYNTTMARPRRLTDTERDFLAGWRAQGDAGTKDGAARRGPDATVRTGKSA
jgi:acyl-CoA thioester hydrolase